MPLRLTVALSRYDRTLAVMDGRVAIEGCEATFIDLEPEEMFHRALHHEEFDAAELSFSNYISLIAEGKSPYIGIPAFTGRKFRHSGIFINTRSGIEKPEDFKGKIVGAPEYQVTAVTWIRGAFEDDYGVKPSDIRWRWGGLQQAGRKQKVAFTPPKDVEIEGIPEGQTLQQMLADGEIDALISPRAPSCFEEGHADVARLFPNYIEVEKDYFRRTGIFPIMHLVAIHRKIVEASPWLPVSLFKALEQAKSLAYEDCAYNNNPRITNPWMESYTTEIRQLMGEDYWPYGFEENRETIETFLRYHHQHRLSARQLKAEEIFAASTLERSRI